MLIAPKKTDVVLTAEEYRKREFWMVCRSREELYLHIRTFLNIDLPRHIIDEFSTSTPLDFIWSIYNTMLTNSGDFRHVVATSRNCCKTLCSAILHFYALLHFRRDCCQLAATKTQSQACIKYLDKFLMIPEVEPYADINNREEKILKNLPANDFTNRNDAQILVIVATIKGANSSRGSFCISDEFELIDPDIVSEAANIADPTRNEGFDPISIYLSSRKFANGPLQALIDDAENIDSSGTKLHKWSVADFMKRCPDTLHQPIKPKVPALIHRETLEVLWGEDASNIENKSHFIEIIAYAGCRKCGAFIACQARSVRQEGRSSMLRTPNFVAGRLRDVKDVRKIISQILNWKPESSGLVYPMFSPHLHVKNAIEAWKWVTRGQLFNPMKLTPAAYEKCLYQSEHSNDKRLVTPTKKDFYEYFVTNGWKIHWGIDWGYTDPAALVIVAYHKKEGRAFVLHSELRTGYSNQDWVEYCVSHYGEKFFPDLVCPDMADAAAPSYFAKHRFPVRDTKPLRIESGVSQIRSLLWNVATQEVNFCILEDRLSVDLVEEFQKWTHERTPTGYNFDKFEKDQNNHGQDSLRYSLDTFIENTDIVFSANQKKETNISDLFEKARNTNDIDAQIELARKQMSDYFAKEHGINDINANSQFKVPFTVLPGQSLPSFELVQKSLEKTEKRRSGFFFKFK